MTKQPETKINVLLEHYKNEVARVLMDEFGLTNVMAVPKITRVVINIGLKEAVSDKGVLERVKSQLTDIAGQLPKVTRSKKSIANFKVRAGDPVGLTVTLRGKKMYDFMSKLFWVALPRMRDFQGVSLTAFDKAGNYTLGLAEQIVFPEIDYAKIDKVRGLEITFVNTAKDGTMAKRLLQLMGMPFKKA